MHFARLGFVFAICLNPLYLLAEDIGIAISNNAKNIPVEDNPIEPAIRKAIDSYLSAFNAGDAAAVAGHWKDDGEFTLPSGKKLTGQEELKATFAEYFENSKGAKLELLNTSVSMLSPNVGIETGIARVISPDGNISDTQYQAVHVNTKSGWKIDSLEESETPELPPSHYEKLKGLEWMIGEWVDQTEGATITTNCRWTSNRNFLVRSFKVAVDDGIEFEGTQVIGWDQTKKTIRSWLFDSDGGFGVGIWTQNGDSWVVRTLNTLSDGRQASATNIYKLVDDQTMTFRSIGRQVDGELMPKMAPITVTRQ